MESRKELVWKIAKLGVPLIVGQLGLVLQSFADTMMVGQYGTMELSASGFVGNIFNLAIFFLLGISFGTTPVVGALFSRNNYRGTARVFRESLLVNIAAGVLVSLLLTILYVNIYKLGNQNRSLWNPRQRRRKSDSPSSKGTLTNGISKPLWSLFNGF